MCDMFLCDFCQGSSAWPMIETCIKRQQGEPLTEAERVALGVPSYREEIAEHHGQSIAPSQEYIYDHTPLRTQHEEQSIWTNESYRNADGGAPTPPDYQPASAGSEWYC